MASRVSKSTERRASCAVGSLPVRVRCLFMTTAARTGGWLAEALAADSATRVEIAETTSPSDGLALLGEQVFDAVLVSHDPPELDALALVEGLRAGGNEEPLLVLGTASEAELGPLCFEVGADGYISVSSGTARGLLWSMARGIERQQMLRENRRLQDADRQRLQHEQREAERWLADQRALAGGDNGGASNQGGPSNHDGSASHADGFPAALRDHYRDLLRAHVMMGTGNMRREMTLLADLLANLDIRSGAALRLHTDTLAELIRGLGNRSARHVMSRADLLGMELLVYLTAEYRRRYLERAPRAAAPPNMRLERFDDR